MFDIARKALIAALFAGAAGPAFAADPYYPPVEPAPPVVVEPVATFGGWYIRGDLDYHWSDFRGANYILYDPAGSSNDFDSGDLDGTGSIGLGIGYQINKYLRADLTGDYWFDADFNGHTSAEDCGNGNPCSSNDSSQMSAFLLLANAYVDLGTWHGITPYVGAGIGGANVKWDDLKNSIDGDVTSHSGGSEWRFAYGLMVGASYCLTDQLKLDAGYRFSQIDGGKMFGYNNGAGPGYDKGFYTNEIRAGLRYQFGPSGCAAPVVAYEPEPIYTK